MMMMMMMTTTRTMMIIMANNLTEGTTVNTATLFHLFHLTPMHEYWSYIALKKTKNLMH